MSDWFYFAYSLVVGLGTFLAASGWLLLSMGSDSDACKSTWENFKRNLG